MIQLLLLLVAAWTWSPATDPEVDHTRVYYSKLPFVWCEEFSHVEAGEVALTDTPDPVPGELIYVDLVAEPAGYDRDSSRNLHGPRYGGVCPWRWF